jgi:hypothetical protein
MTTLDEQILDDRSIDELAGRLAEHQLATALVRKSPADPVPFPVWWRVADALRATVMGTPDDGVAEIDATMAALHSAVPQLAVSPPAVVPVVGGDSGRSVRRAQLLVARLLLTPSPTSPTLLQVRLARLRRALVAGSAG